MAVDLRQHRQRQFRAGKKKKRHRRTDRVTDQRNSGDGFEAASMMVV
jgi:hypothetical protein